jgi:hypothetical protein
MNMSHDHIDFGPQIPFLGSGGLFLSFWPPQVHIYSIYTKFPIDWWVTWPISFLSLPLPRDLADSKIFWAKNIQHQITKYSAYSEILLSFWSRRDHVTYIIYIYDVVHLKTNIVLDPTFSDLNQTFFNFFRLFLRIFWY